MKRFSAILAAVIVLWAAGASAAPAASGPDCPVPDALALRDLSLPRAKEAAARTGRLVVLSLGGVATAGAAAGDPEATYPARLQADLRAALPGMGVSVVNQGGVSHPTAGILRNLPEALRQSGASLVIWASGAREAAHGADVDEYTADLQRGIEASRAAGADVILVDLQYAPSIARIVNSGPYRDALYGAAQENDVPVLRRYDLMMQWNDDNVMNLDAEDPAERREVARHLFACIAALLAPAIADAVR